jgi:hypothetical protein
VLDIRPFLDLRLRGGFTIVSIEIPAESMEDSVGRPALAKTRITGRKLHLMILSTLNDDEKSVTIYHEVLEAMTVVSIDPPLGVQDFNESDFEQAAYRAHEQFGPVSPVNLDRMLQFYGFREE